MKYDLFFSIIMTTTSLIRTVQDRYLNAPNRTSESLGIAIKVATDEYVENLSRLSLPESDMTSLRQSIEDGKELSTAIIRHLDQYFDPTTDTDDSTKDGQVLYTLASQIASALRLNQSTITNEGAQTIIADAFGLVGDIADCSATEFYLGKNAINEGQANELIEEYFSSIPFRPSVQDMQSGGSPIDLFLTDWAAGVEYCRNQGVPAEAFLRDGTNLFRFAPNSLSYVYDHSDDFPELDLKRINHGPTVEAWLKSVTIGVNPGQVDIANWNVLLTGYTPEDNAEIPGLNERYNAPLLSTALSIENRRL